MPSINPQPDSWECFMSVRSASQGSGPAWGAQFVQRGSALVKEGRLAQQQSLGLSPVAIKWRLFGWYLIEIENAGKEKALWMCILPDSHILDFLYFSMSSKVIILKVWGEKTFLFEAECLLPPPRLPSAAAVSPCQVSALDAWRTSRCWRPSWGPIPTATSCMWWTPGLRWALCA